MPHRGTLEFKQLKKLYNHVWDIQNCYVEPIFKMLPRKFFYVKFLGGGGGCHPSNLPDATASIKCQVVHQLQRLIQYYSFYRETLRTGIYVLSWNLKSRKIFFIKSYFDIAYKLSDITASWQKKLLEGVIGFSQI